MTTSRPESAARGRPRCPDAHQAVLQAARRLLLGKQGYGGVTMEGLARESGVSKPTIYRWWPTKAAIFREIYVIDGADFLERADTGSLEGDLRMIMRGLCRLYTTTPHGRSLVGMFAEAQLDPRIMPDFAAGLQALREKGTQGAIKRAIRRGELRRDFDLDFGSDLLFGPILYRLMVAGRPLNRRFVDRIVDCFLRGAGIAPGNGAAR